VRPTGRRANIALWCRNALYGLAFARVAVRISLEHCSLSHRKNTMPTGTVKWFNATKGYGFIEPQNGGGDVFLHISALERAGLSSVNEGDKLSYELEKDNRSGKMSAGQISKA
jgi:CspA family cold shock protein